MISFSQENAIGSIINANSKVFKSYSCNLSASHYSCDNMVSR